MAFLTGNRARKKETTQNVVGQVFESFEAAVGVFTRIPNPEVNDIDKLYASTYYHRVKTEQPTRCLEKANDIEKEPCVVKDLLDLVRLIESSGDDIMKDIYPILTKDKPKPYCFNSIVSRICTAQKPMPEINRKIDVFEFINASEYSVTKEQIDFLQKISSFDERMKKLYSTTKVKFLDSVWSDECCPDLLGLYTKIRNNQGEMVPQVWLFLNKIYEENEKYCDKCGIQGEGRKNALKYMIAYVYIHEMMHRYFDIRPDLNLKRSVPKIEEPLAEYATLKFCESFRDDRNNLLLDISEKMVKEMRNSRYPYYALGYDLFKSEDVPSDLKEKYQRVSMIIHQDNDPVHDMFKSGVGVNSIVNLINHYDEILQKAKDKDTGK